MNAASEPLESLLEKIDRARTLPEPEPYNRTWDDPLEKIRERMRGEPGDEDGREGGAPSAAPGRDEVESPGAAATQSAGRATSGGAAAIVGRQVLEALKNRPLDGASRVEAVERLAAQIDDPEPEQLLEILGVLVAGKSD